MQIHIRIYGRLNDFISKENRQRSFIREIPETTTVKDLIEGCGVPHTEMDVILINGEPVHFNRQVADNDRVSVYPVFMKVDVPVELRLQKRSLHNPRFLADVNLGRLARYLRLAGFDTAYRNDAKDPELVEQMKREDRVLLTRDRRLLMNGAVEAGYFVRSDIPVRQLEEVFYRFDLYRQRDPFSRCSNCNHRLSKVEKEAVKERLLPKTKRYVDDFSQCPECRKVYWSGSHLDRLEPELQKLLFSD